MLQDVVDAEAVLILRVVDANLMQHGTREDSQVRLQTGSISQKAYAKPESEGKQQHGLSRQAQIRRLSPVRARLSQSASLRHPGQGDDPPAAG